MVSGNSVKWIPLEGMELTAADLAPAEKLRKFGFSLVCCSFGSGKLTKAGLCIYDVLAEKETPNILVVTSAREIYGWYRILMTGIGADFKVINGAANEIVFFTGDSSNLYLCPPAALDAANGLKTKVPADFQWDLIIVDDEQSLSAPDCRKLSERIPWKSERLLMFTQFPAQNGEERAALSEFVKSTLAEEANASCADGLAFTHLEVGHALAGIGDGGFLSGDFGDFINGIFHGLLAVRVLAHAGGDNNLLQAGNLMHVLVCMLRLKAGNDLFTVVCLQCWCTHCFSGSALY